MKKFYNFNSEWESEDKQIEFLDLLFEKCNNAEFKKIEFYNNVNFNKIELSITDFKDKKFTEFLKDQIDCIVAKNGIEFTLDDFGNLTEVRLLGSNFSRDNGKNWETEEEVYKIN